MRTLHVAILSAILTTIGLAIFWYKVQWLEFPLAPDHTYNSWRIEARMNLISSAKNRKGDNPAILTLRVPSNSSRYAIVDENYIDSGFGKDVERIGGNKTAQFTKKKIGRSESIYYRAMVYGIDSPVTDRAAEARPAVTSPFAPANRPASLMGPEDPLIPAIDSLSNEARERSADEASYVREAFKLAEKLSDDRVRVINGTLELQSDVGRIAAVVIEAGNIPTRVARGIKLTQEQRHTKLHRWLETYVGGRWQAVDPVTHHFGLAEPYLVWFYGEGALYTSKGVREVDVSLSVKQNTDKALTRAIWKSGEIAGILLKFSFYNLPLDTQLLFQVLLMIPIGGLVIAVLRQVIGVKTFGTFMPVLVALAFRETGLFSGIVLFVTIIALGLLVRAYLARLHLLLVPRLASVLTVVVIILSLLAMTANNFGFVTGLSISLFPIVILTMTIERISLMWDEYGAKSAIKTSLGSLASAMLAFLFMNSEIMNHLILTFPELLLVVLSATLLLGRYNGYKLTEYSRFKALNRELERARLSPPEG